MKPLIAIALLLLTCSSAVAGHGEVRLVQPKGTHLSLVQLNNNLTYAKFVGHIWVKGTFVARWADGAADKSIKSPDYTLIPDASSIKELPYFVLDDPPYHRVYKVQFIDLVNGAQALRLAVGDATANQLLHRKIDQIRAVGDFLIQGYTVGVECDAPWAHALLVKYRPPTRLARTYQMLPESC